MPPPRLRWLIRRCVGSLQTSGRRLCHASSRRRKPSQACKKPTSRSGGRLSKQRTSKRNDCRSLPPLDAVLSPRSHHIFRGSKLRAPFSSDIFGTVAKGSSMSKPSPQVALHYADYLKLAALLSIQQPESARHGRSAHDEMLFIIVHQTYELWFKQILHELDRIQLDFGGDVVEDEYLGRIVHGLERINEILKLLIQQLEVLETMTPLDFRDFLFPASGFQSGQFRLIEIRLGLARGARSQYAGKPFDDTLTEADRSRIATAERGPKLIDQLDRWLSRTPFVHRPDYDFSLEYRKAVKQMLEDDAARVRRNEAMSPQQRETKAKRIEASLEEFQAIFAPASGPAPWQMSRAAVQAALFIIVYRDRPVLQLPFRLLAALMNV